MADRVSITSPVGRLVAGSLYKEVTADFDGNPLKYKTGPKTGQSRVEFYFGLAVPKTKAAWWEEVWGQQILQVGSVAFPGSYQRKDFAWKITDGDSTELTKKNTRPCDNEGYPGHWVLNLRGGYAPKLYHLVNNEPVTLAEGDLIKTGHYAQVYFNVEGNGNSTNPGVYLNHSMVCRCGFGPEISVGADVKSAAFGGAPLPPGASATPLAGSMPFPSVPATSAGVPPAPTFAPSAPAAPVASPIPVLPNPQFLQMPAPPATGVQIASGASLPVVGASIPAPPNATIASPSSPRYRMTQAGTREEWLAKGWTDAQLIQGGYMVQE